MNNLPQGCIVSIYYIDKEGIPRASDFSVNVDEVKPLMFDLFMEIHQEADLSQHWSLKNEENKTW